MSDPITTKDQAIDWLYYQGFSIRLIANDPRIPLPDNADVAIVETLRRLIEDTPPSERVTPCPPELASNARKALAIGMRAVVLTLTTLRRGANELGLHEVARKLWNMGADLSSLAGMVQP